LKIIIWKFNWIIKLRLYF